MFVEKVKGRQLARIIALIYIILWVLFIILMVTRFDLSELLGIKVLIPIIVTTIVNLSVALITHVSSYKIKNNNYLCILYGILCLFSFFWYFNLFGLILSLLFACSILIIRFGEDT